MKLLVKSKHKKKYDSKQLNFGTSVEMEHTSDEKTARKIAMDHLDEDPDYYKDWNAKEKILFQPRAPRSEKIKKAMGYIGPMSVADIELASWNEFFREGGSLNQPAWLQTNRLKQIRSNYASLARLHGPMRKAMPTTTED